MLWSKENQHESESVYASESDQNIYYVNVDGLGRPSETIQEWSSWDNGFPETIHINIANILI